MTDPRHTLGQHGEAFVAQHLEAAGYVILDRNWRHGKHGEIDLIARRENEIAFVEVRTRRGPLQAAVDAAISSVTPDKQRRLLTLVQAYRDAHRLDGLHWRIDVAAVAVQGTTFVVEIMYDAVEW
ncbi:MAG: YraN family protein [Anaerolineae bacterium]|nr:YraN family protein [Anaerolineae bacterium]